MIKISNWQRGFTLIEMIIYISLLSGFLLILTNVFVSVLRIRTETQASSSTEQDGRFILTRLAYDINRSTAVTVPNATTLTLTIGAQTYTYSLSGTNLQLVQPAGTDLLNGSGSTVTSLAFQKISNVGGKEDTIKVQIILTSVAKEANNVAETRSFSTTIGRRIR